VSNVFVKGTAPFYSVPQALVSSGKLKNLREGAHKLYQLILYTAQQRTRVAVELSNRGIRELAGLSPNTVRRARTELSEAGLVDLKQVPGGRYTYVILNPLTGSPLPHPRSQPVGNTQSTPSTPPATTPFSASFAPSWSEIGK
jgi:DNA-binding transcriptional ArsR family regulator